ncbi:hypothetical protein BO79DRAFT_233784 [Aspergillus costaricaensis CBS 115574]|uniref:Uncharacterized protein n=1 Tax=Aspergillus costaricaensis CBS 115574 TaxID=1448317 RepID=A0ACD1HYA0_9EURO|nr:hypothetical protein BO79DRAFT_233784 [Aspergillus costaricaensis CBS 115574]RAK82930.1 hypothetical protein BO79DRAFT_233784 [Aspergillus costaricaensis CBS 115574]
MFIMISLFFVSRLLQYCVSPTLCLPPPLPSSVCGVKTQTLFTDYFTYRAPAPLPFTHPGARANHPWPRIHLLQLRLAKLGADDVIPDESEAFGTLSVAPVWSPLPARVRLRALNGHPGGVGRNF